MVFRKPTAAYSSTLWTDYKRRRNALWFIFLLALFIFKNSPRFPIWKNVFPFNDCNVISGIWQSWLWKSRGRFSFKSRATISGILRPRDTSSVAKARVQRKEHVYHVLMRLIFSPFPTPAAVCSQFFLRNNLFCSKIRTTR